MLVPMSPFERKLSDLLTEALKTDPPAQVVGGLIGAAIATTIQAGLDPRKELPSTIDKALAIMLGNGQKLPS
jgi:hypothetical protein